MSYGNSKILCAKLQTEKDQTQVVKKICCYDSRGINNYGGGLRGNIEVCFMKKISIHPATIFVWIWMLIVLGPLVALGCFFAIVIHECGHVVVAKILGYKMSKFSLSPYGCSLSYFEQTINYSDEIKIALAGPFANLLSAVFVVGFWWLFPNLYFFSSSFVFSSFALALFNLLPAYPLDGGRVFVALGSNYFSEKLARKLIVWFNLILSFFFMALFVIFLFVNFNPTYFLVAFFLIVGVLDLANLTSFVARLSETLTPSQFRKT